MSAKKRRAFGVVTSQGKVVRESVLEQYSAQKVASGRESGQISKSEDRFKGEYTREGLVEPPYDLETLGELLNLNTWHKRSINMIAQDVSGMGWEIAPDREDSEGGKESDKEKLEEFYLELDTPISATLRNLMVDIGTFGYGSLELVKQNRSPDGDPVNLFHVRAKTVRVHKSGDRYQQKKGKNKKWFRDVDYADKPIGRDDGETTSARQGDQLATEMMWFTEYSHETEHYGTPKITPAIGAIYGDYSQKRFNVAFFDNYGMPAWAVFITGDYDEGEVVDEETGETQLQRDIGEQFQQFGDEPHSIMTVFVPQATREGSKEAVGQVEVEFVKLDVDVKDASFRLYRLDNRDEVIQANGVPKRRLGIEEEGALAGNSAREMTEVYKTSVLAPYREAIESVLTRFVHQGGFGIKGWKLKLKEIDTRDVVREADAEQKKADRIMALVKEGFMTPNDGREELGYKRIEKSDPRYVPELDQFKLGMASFEMQQMRAAQMGRNGGKPPDYDGDLDQDSGKAENRIDQRVENAAA